MCKKAFIKPDLKAILSLILSPERTSGNLLYTVTAE